MPRPLRTGRNKKTGEGDPRPFRVSRLVSAFQEVADRLYERGLLLVHQHVTGLSNHRGFRARDVSHELIGVDRRDESRVRDSLAGC